jgi:hypothetical protein
VIPSAFLHEPLDDAGTAVARHSERFALRATVTAGSLAALQFAAFGLTWDIVWHTYVGRDRFLTPPHLVIYASVALATLLLALDLAVERRAAPRGLLVAAGGMLSILAAAAPFDNAWHAWYGIDVTLWAPFHVMGLIGVGIALLGLAYACAHLAHHARIFSFGVYLALASGCSLAYVFAEPALRVVFRIGTSHLAALLPAVLICAVGMTFCTLAGIAYARDSRAALGVLGLYLARAALFNTLAPVLTQFAATRAAIAYRVPGFEPVADSRIVLISLTLVPVAFALALARDRASSTFVGAVGCALVALATSAWVAAAQAVVLPLPHAAPPLGLDVVPLALPATTLVALAAGAALAAPARGLGRLLRSP